MVESASVLNLMSNLFATLLCPGCAGGVDSSGCKVFFVKNLQEIVSLTNLVIWREEELVEHLSLPVRPRPVTEVGRLLAGDVQAPAGGRGLDKVPAGSREQLRVLWNQACLVLVVVQPHLEVA